MLIGWDEMSMRFINKSQQHSTLHPNWLRKLGENWDENIRPLTPLRPWIKVKVTLDKYAIVNFIIVYHHTKFEPNGFVSVGMRVNVKVCKAVTKTAVVSLIK